MTLDDRIDLVYNAIHRYDRNKEEWLRLEREPSSSSEERSLARERVASSEREFGWQIDNVRAILESKS